MHVVMTAAVCCRQGRFLRFSLHYDRYRFNVSGGCQVAECLLTRPPERRVLLYCGTHGLNGHSEKQAGHCYFQKPASAPLLTPQPDSS